MNIESSISRAPGGRQYGVLFVCLGNICRSPSSEGVFRSMVESRSLDCEIKVDSAGTAGYHVGARPDSRAIEAAAKRGVCISNLRARRVNLQDYAKFDYIIAMDLFNYEDLVSLAPSDYKGRICLFMDFAPQWEAREIPDPYYGGGEAFELMLDMIEAASKGLIEDIRKRTSSL
ncbi:MAG: low molecular weight phosphotyrosine protein phosphatase [Acidiferrobacterales bacterium]|nr:low molecular weight phosphotyrosine protein phosphatase [Acidiferrobacterales bacterium]